MLPVSLLILCFEDYFQCPGPEDPPDHLLCCGADCCLPLSSHSLVRTVLIIIVIMASLATFITILTCCLWSRCPLYTTCTITKKSRSPPLAWVKYSRTWLLSSQGWGTAVHDGGSNQVKIVVCHLRRSNTLKFTLMLFQKFYNLVCLWLTMSQARVLN